VGEALIALLHDDLKSMGITSVGHRLTILKCVYDVKKAQDVPTESDHYVPQCTYPATRLPPSRGEA
jgi:protein STE50